MAWTWKKCKTCLRVRAACDFETHPTCSGGLHSKCRECERSRRIETYNNRPKIHERVRNHCIKHRRKLKAIIIKEYGGECKCCGDTTFEFLQIDHTNGDGNIHRKTFSGPIYYWLKRNGFPKDGFRLLCSNCNHSIGLYGYCPHHPETKTEK